MSTTDTKFEVLKSLVTSLETVEGQLSNLLSQLRGLLYVVKRFLQDSICDHRFTTPWIDYSESRLSGPRITCDDCKKWW